MSELSEVALAFARECMKWQGNVGISRQGDWIYCDTPPLGRFDYTDLNAVMAAFRAYLKTHPGWLWSMERCPNTDYVLVTIVYGDDSSGRADVFNENVCHALMAACVGAQRKVARAA